MGFPQKKIHIYLTVTLWIEDHFLWRSSSHCSHLSACAHQVNPLVLLINLPAFYYFEFVRCPMSIFYEQFLFDYNYKSAFVTTCDRVLVIWLSNSIWCSSNIKSIFFPLKSLWNECLIKAALPLPYINVIGKYHLRP